MKKEGAHLNLAVVAQVAGALAALGATVRRRLWAGAGGHRRQRWAGRGHRVVVTELVKLVLFDGKLVLDHATRAWGRRR